ncbi:hypothetical protein EMIHUDRAFT_448792 [Emiliania huxleyi CCMP1516]|uniref:CS domain-containing protein n=2 Tax=Emiliania huxleyi TaxID=2903 RepID=A0A0D3L089_EMIH1|nr:hypothetical protein EMIHUDRAFT_448792 [Emiliania huxleyi CCMP1516]EOD41424.1 hypothetical protein EMIHUDRAFT_448792 [Emiliania huxleyi CCMP1516]|eukprot:XP_005793853.1 hypothetical protein EMIHUDRAFT_448792 [Emiliania huxleyi CCMP1516]
MAYTWRQDNATATCGIVVPTGTAHSQLKVVLSRRRLTLELAGSGVLLRRRLFAPVVPRRTRAYTLYVPESGAESTELRLVLFKEKVAGWSSLFCGDGRRQHLQESLAGENAPVCALPEHDGAQADAVPDSSAGRGAFSAARARQAWRRQAVDGGTRVARVAPAESRLAESRLAESRLSGRAAVGGENGDGFSNGVAAAPITRKPPPQPSPGGAPGNGMLQRRDMLQRRAEPAAKPPSRGGGGGALIKEINLLVRIPPDMARRDIRVEIKPLLLRMVARGHVLLAGSLDKPVVAGEATWTYEPGEVHVMLPKETGGPVFSRLFPSEEKLSPALAIKQVCDDEPYQGRYMDLSPEARKIVDMHRNFNHARATGKGDWATELEEEMKMMRFSWGAENKDEWERE